jgi:hypothetical protein
VEFGFVFTLKTKQFLQLNLFERRDLMSLFRPPGSRYKLEISQPALLKTYETAVRVCISGCHHGNMSGVFGLLT